ncbi:MAG: ATP-binding cassette domain-containing protein, partial [Lachnospiraceae bacterium]|nr:ATP-binding cassette domain-containing protein [Lachnospiraceae bacterium]
TVEENIAAALHGAARNPGSGRTSFTDDRNNGDSVSGILKQFGLWDIRDHRPAELSGGQQQRTALARMMACDPGLLLLDEPFSAMDTFLREGMRLELIKLLNMYDKTVIMVSHDRDEIYQMCNYLILMDKGRVIARGETDRLFENPGSPAAARLTGCKNISRIVRLNDHRIRALDWHDIELVTDERVTDDITHAGIRAHDFIPGEHGVNVIPCGQAMISRLPFEWYVTLENGLWWKQSRELDESYRSSVVPQYISVMPDKILLMKE